MQEKKFHIEKNSIQETLVIPLYARKFCTEIYPTLFRDEKALKLVNRLDYDFSLLEKKSKKSVYRFGALEIAMRQLDLQIEIKEYLSEHPNAAVVNLGCGLDETGENCDNGKCKIYNLDMPDVIKIRNELLPPDDRIHNIACDLNNTAWFDKIDAQNGAVFFASGVFYYFTIENMRKLINEMAEHFRGGKLVFDITGRLGLKMMLKVFVKQAQIKDINAYFHIDSLKRDVLPWIKNAKVSQRGYMLGYHDLKEDFIPASFRLLSKIGDNFIKMQITRFYFDE